MNRVETEDQPWLPSVPLHWGVVRPVEAFRDTPSLQLISGTMYIQNEKNMSKKSCL